MDHAVIPIKKIQDAFKLALESHPDREAAAHAAAQELGITAEAVSEALAITEGVPA